MNQRVYYPVFPGVKDPLYLVQLNKVLYFIDENRPKQKELRVFLQEEGMWNRELMAEDEFWAFYGIEKGKRYRLQKFGLRLLDARSEPAVQKELLFRRMLRDNEILSKYVFDALNERLHSDAELYRYITSYVYPGETVPRPQFMNWIRLLSILGYIRVLGIRWALSETGEETMKLIDQIDVEALLEEEEEEDEEEEEEEEEEDEDRLAERIARRSAPEEEEEPEEEPEQEPEASSDEGPDLPDAPPAPKPRSRRKSKASAPASPSAAAQGAPASAATPAVTYVAAPPIAPPELRPLPHRPLPAAARPFGPEQIAENVERLRAWWTDFEDVQPRRATDFGLGGLEYEMQPASFFLKVLAVGTITLGDPRPADRWGFINKLSRVRFFPRLVDKGEELYAVLKELDFFADDQGHRLLAENLLTFLRHRETLAAKPELLEELAKAEDGPALIAQLRELFYDGCATVEPHWVVREMHAFGIWKAPTLRTVCAVPERKTRQVAYRLGFLDSPFASCAEDLLHASSRIASVLGPEDGFDEPLYHLPLCLGCKASCPHAEGCEYHCRERFDL